METRDVSETSRDAHPAAGSHWDRDSWNIEPDSIALAFSALSPQTAGKVMKEAFYGTRRFEDFQNRSGLSRGILAARLSDLVSMGLLEKHPYRESGARERHEYRLTDKGRSLAPALIALTDWAAKWLVDPAGPTVTLTHRDCGAEVHAVIACEAGHQLGGVGEVAAVPGPGATPTADYRSDDSAGS
jgi:DNA-binding HxlR family transcriptional regulator